MHVSHNANLKSYWPYTEALHVKYECLIGHRTLWILNISSSVVYKQWWHHFIMISHLHVVTGFNQINQSMNLDDRAGDTVDSVCVTSEKDMALQQQIWSTFVIVLWCCKTKITDETRILVLVRVLWDMISKIYWQFWHSFFKNALEGSYNFYPIEIRWSKMTLSVWHQCQWQCDVCIDYDVSLYQHISGTFMSFCFEKQNDTHKHKKT